MEEYLKVGVISSTHGLQGEVKVFPTTDDSSRFNKLKHVFMDTGKEYKVLEIQRVKFFKQMVILKFKDLNHINDIEKYKGNDLYVKRKDAVKLEADEYFIADLVGLRVFTEEGEDLGTVQDVIQTGANDVYITGGEGKEEILIPAIKECILDINMKERQMKVHLMKGLR